MQDNKNKKYIALLGLLVLVGGGVLAGNYLVETWAKYTKTLTEYNQSKQIAKWNVTNTTGSVPTIITIDGNDAADTSTLNADRIAPGTKGEFNIQINNSSEVAMDYNLLMAEITKPTNVVVKLKNAGGSTEQNPVDATLAQGGHITGTIAAGGNKTLNFTWEWPFETTNGDSNDTANATTSLDNAQKMTFKFSGTANQVAPSSTAVTTTVYPTYTAPTSTP